jgi:hypothetical protein
MYALYRQLAEFQLLSAEILQFDALVFLILLKMQRCDVSCVQWAYVPSRNQIQKIITVSDSDKDKHYALQESDEEEPRPPLRRCSVSRPPSPDYSASSRSIWP